MELTNTNLRYLLAIYDLSRARLEVSSKDIAQLLAVSRASVTSMMTSQAAICPPATTSIRFFGALRP